MIGSWLRWATLVLTVAACAGIGVAAYLVAGYSWDAVVEYESPYAAIDLPASEAESEVASRTAVIIVDGLRLDASRRMGTLNALREHGSDLELRVPEPSLSYPNWTAALSGAPPSISGVVTNWHEGAAPVETVFDTARRAGARTVFVGPEDFDVLYGVREKCTAVYLRKWNGRYLTGEFVSEAIRLTERERPRLLIVHLPDLDEVGHDFGGMSEQYAAMAGRIDADLRLLVEALEDGNTAFVVVTDHGHLDSGGHGGWENDVATVPGVFSGRGTRLGSGAGLLEDVASTVSVLAGIGAPRYGTGSPLDSALALEPDHPARTKAALQSVRFGQAFADYVTQGLDIERRAQLDAQLEFEGPRLASQTMPLVAQQRLEADRDARLPYALAIAAACIVALLLIGVASWRALVAALIGTAAYYGIYNLLFFGIHDYNWSLSAFNAEEFIDAWMNLRLAEAALCALAASAVAAAAYPLLRERPKGPRGRYLAGWLTLGPVTVLAILATLGLQVAWFVWAWGIVPEWSLPDLRWGFKYDLDLVQATALGAAALVTPLVTYLVGRYHPKVRTSADVTTAEETMPHGHQGPA